MSEEELLKKNNVLMSHGHLPYDTSTCETYGLSGNCGKKCPNFKNKTCDVYVDVLERINQELQQQNQKYKEVIDKINDHIRTCCNMDSKFTNLHYDYAQNEMSADQVDELLDILKEVK